MYFAFVNYTTLGYGDVVPEVRWRLLDPATAMCGMLLFGWSTALIFDILPATRAERCTDGRFGGVGFTLVLLLSELH